MANKKIFPDVDIQYDSHQAEIETYLRIQRKSDAVWFLVRLASRWDMGDNKETHEKELLTFFKLFLFHTYRTLLFYIVPEEGKFMTSLHGDIIGGERDIDQRSEEERIKAEIYG